MSKGTKQIRMGRVQSLLEELQIALHYAKTAHEAYAEDTQVLGDLESLMVKFNSGRVSAFEQTIERILNKFPELKENEENPE